MTNAFERKWSQVSEDDINQAEKFMDEHFFVKEVMHKTCVSAITFDVYDEDTGQLCLLILVKDKNDIATLQADFECVRKGLLKTYPIVVREGDFVPL